MKSNGESTAKGAIAICAIIIASAAAVWASVGDGHRRPAPAGAPAVEKNP